METHTRRSHCCPTIVFSTTPRSGPCGFACFSSQKTSWTHTHTHLLESVLHACSVYHSALHSRMHGKVCSLYSTSKIRITCMSELHVSFKNRYTYSPLTYLIKEDTWLPEEPTGRDIMFNQNKWILCLLCGKGHCIWDYFILHTCHLWDEKCCTSYV